MQPGNIRDWSVWTFDHGMLATGYSDPPGKERVAAVWVQDNLVPPSNRMVRVHWRLPGQSHDWFNVHVYNTAVGTSPGDAPGSDVNEITTGDANNRDTSDEGDATFPPDTVEDMGVVQNSSWSVIIEGCDPHFDFLGIQTGHECHANILPKLTVNVAPPPAQPFSCAAYVTKPKRVGTVNTHILPGGGLVMEVGGSCSSSPYGTFVYTWQKYCATAPPTATFVATCPADANNYGFVVVAPSRGWTMSDFADLVEGSIAGHTYLPTDAPSTVGIPVSPPVFAQRNPDGTTTWLALGLPTTHTVKFRWRGTLPGDANILSDTGAPSVFGPLAADPATWPTALGHISAPDLTAGNWELIHSTGAGCFTVVGLPTPLAPDPLGLLVDLRNPSSPTIGEPRSSSLATACP
jgi:hypothetical protein